MVRSNDIVGKAVTDSFQISVDYVEKHADLVSSAVTDTNMENNLVKKHFTRDGWNQGLNNSLARHPGLVISTFGLAEIISCMPDGLVKQYIGY